MSAGSAQSPDEKAPDFKVIWTYQQLQAVPRQELKDKEQVVIGPAIPRNKIA